MTKILKICCSEWRNASRDKRELGLCREMGMEVCVLAKGQEGLVEDIDGFEVHRKGTRPLGKKIPNSINRVVSVFTWAKAARKFEADIISGHDLLGLLVGYLSSMFLSDSRRPKLVYDSHEFELGRNKKRSHLEQAAVKKLEGFLIRHSAFTIVVNDSIADAVQTIYHLEKRPVVVRSTPNLWAIDENETKKMHAYYCEQLGVSTDSFIVMYHGGLLPDRGIETLLQLLSINPNIYGVVLGNGEEAYVKSLYKLAEELKVSSKVLFLPAVPLSELWRYVGAADLGLILIPANCENHRLSLPNKFFENIQAENPIVCPEYPAMSSIVKQYDNGLVFKEKDIVDLSEKVDYLKNNPSDYSEKKKGAKTAKADLCWEKEQEVLQKAYKQLIKWGGASYYLMLPNKFFENIQSGTPVLASHYPEMIKLIRRYQIGLLADPLSIPAINEQIEIVRTSHEIYNSMKNNVAVAKQSLCWEKEKQILLDAYNEIM